MDSSHYSFGLKSAYKSPRRLERFPRLNLRYSRVVRFQKTVSFAVYGGFIKEVIVMLIRRKNDVIS